MPKPTKTPAKWREDRGLTLEALAEKAGIAPNTLRKVESGTPGASTRVLRIVARSLGVSVRDYADAYLSMPEPVGNASGKGGKS